MKCFDLATLALTQGGEYVLGEKDLHSRACYFVYGRLEAREKNRLVRPGAGYEEILCAVDGPLLMHTSHGDVVLPEGHAVHVKENESFPLSNPSDKSVTYVMAGGLRSRPNTVPSCGPVP